MPRWLKALAPSNNHCRLFTLLVSQTSSELKASAYLNMLDIVVTLLVSQSSGLKARLNGLGVAELKASASRNVVALLVSQTSRWLNASVLSNVPMSHRVPVEQLVEGLGAEERGLHVRHLARVPGERLVEGGGGAERVRHRRHRARAQTSSLS